jgi:hypothetical protein
MHSFTNKAVQSFRKSTPYHIQQDSVSVYILSVSTHGAVTNTDGAGQEAPRNVQLFNCQANMRKRSNSMPHTALLNSGPSSVKWDSNAALGEAVHGI